MAAHGDPPVPFAGFGEMRGWGRHLLQPRSRTLAGAKRCATAATGRSGPDLYFTGGARSHGEQCAADILVQRAAVGVPAVKAVEQAGGAATAVVGGRVLPPRSGLPGRPAKPEGR